MASDSQWPAAVEPVPPLPGEPASPQPLPWTGWDVLRIAAFTLAMIFAFVLVFMIGAQKLFYPKLSMMEVAKFPLVSVLAQLGAYVVVLIYMYVVATRSGERFWQAIRWNWPQYPWAYVIVGILLSVALQGLAHVLPMPKTLPIDKFFATPLEAWIVSLFGMTLAPLIEELFFRGFLYPVLARRIGVVLGIVFTAIAFSLIHAPQLARAWGPILIVFLIGFAVTIVRAVKNSVAAGLLMHMAYNGTISVLLFIASGGFRHLEKISQ
jgi:membrane protease YdiL (CAAX protease family)